MNSDVNFGCVRLSKRQKSGNMPLKSYTIFLLSYLLNQSPIDANKENKIYNI